MRPPGRPKGEYRSAQHEGTPVTRAAPGRPKQAGVPPGDRLRYTADEGPT